jgi:hypothetical protein
MRMFQDVYFVRAGDNLSAIAKSRGYQNPGPLFAFPPNQSSFPNVAAANILHPGQRLYIPWHPDLLRKMIVTSDMLIKKTNNFANRLIEEQIRDKDELEAFLLTIDAVNMIAQIYVSIGSLVLEGMQHGGSMTSQHVVNWLADSRVHLFAGDLTPLIIPSPGTPKKDFRFIVRHTLGPWTPSFWASVMTAIKERDIELYLYGPDAILYQTSINIKAQAAHDIARLEEARLAASRQLTMPFYFRSI